MRMNKGLKVCYVLFLLLFSYFICNYKTTNIEINSNKYYSPAGYEPIEYVIEEYESIAELLIGNQWSIGEDKYVVFDENKLTVYRNSGKAEDEATYDIVNTTAIDESTELVVNITVCFDTKINGTNYEIFLNINRRNGYETIYSLRSEYFLNETVVLEKPEVYETPPEITDDDSVIYEGESEVKSESNDSLLIAIVVIIALVVLIIVAVTVLKKVTEASQKY